MSTTDLITESSCFGTVFLLLERNIVKPLDVLEWLKTRVVTENTQIVYKILLKFLPVKDQILQDGAHFLAKNPEYIVYCSEEKEILKSMGVGIPENVRKSIVEFRNILNGESKDSILHLDKIFKTRVNIEIVPQYNGHLLQADWTEKLIFTEELPFLVLERVAFLQKNAPFYLSLVRDKYIEIVRVFKKSKSLTSDNYSAFQEFFPELFPEPLGQTLLEKNLEILNNALAGYCLGFNIQNILPTDEEIKEAIKKVLEVGIDGYCALVKTHSSNEFSSHFFSETVFSNENDCFFEAISDYGPFDVVCYRIGKYCYRFTRAEYPMLLEKGKNPYTNEPLPANIINLVACRVRIASAYGLFSPKPLKDILDVLSSVRVAFYKDVLPMTDTVPIVSNRESTSDSDQSFFDMLFSD